MFVVLMKTNISLRGLFCQLPWQRQPWSALKLNFATVRLPSKQCYECWFVLSLFLKSSTTEKNIIQTISWKKGLQRFDICQFARLWLGPNVLVHEHLMMQDHPHCGIFGLEHEIWVLIACAQKPPLKVYSGVSYDNIGLIIIWTFVYTHTFFLRAV